MSTSIKYKKTKLYTLILIVSLILLIGFIIYYCSLYLKISKVSKISKNILTVYDIQKLYASNTNKNLPKIVSETGNVANILGVISIPKLHLRMPILSECTDEFLKIAPGKFYGNSLNSAGNFCIAGHNYNNNEFFSNLDDLENGDIILLYTLDRF